jgi:CRP-like cAMP-binding protein
MVNWRLKKADIVGRGAKQPGPSIHCVLHLLTYAYDLTLMSNLSILQQAFADFSGMTEHAFELSVDLWKEKSFKKGELFNDYKNVCKELSFIFDGTFRSYIIDSDSGEEQNLFFYSQHGMMTAFKSFVQQIPCEYYTEALTDANVMTIHIMELQRLYRESHEWERFGRLLAEMAANIVIEKMESFLLKSAEERYLELIEMHPELVERVPLYHISSYLGIQGPSLSRIRKRIAQQ